MALDFPNSPAIGDEFTGGGFTWVWTGSSWDKVMASVASGGTGFSLLVGATGNTTYAFDTPQPAGAYSLTSQLGDTTFDIYLVTAANANAGYTNTTALEATTEFDRVVVYGATNNDILNFEYKPSAAPATSGDVADGAAPFLTSATPTTLESIDDTTTVTGGNFANDVEIVFTGQDDIDRPAKNIVRSSSTSLIVTRPDAFPVEQEPFTMTATNAGITNPSTNVNKLTDYFDAGGGITWVTTSPLPDANIGASYSVTLVATDADGTSVGYSLTSGSLPTALSLNVSTGVISGTPTTLESQTFTVTATDAGGNSASREFTLEVVVAAEYLVVAGGGGGGANHGGGGGAGGYRSSVASESSGGGASAESAFSLALATSYTVTVGAGGNGGVTDTVGSNGNNSVFGTITSTAGGGGGARLANASVGAAQVGGSGGGGAGANAAGVGAAGTANQGFAGGNATSNGVAGNGGGGGGAGGLGGNASGGEGTGSSGAGGSGVASAITGSLVARGGGGSGGRWAAGDVGTVTAGGGLGGTIGTAGTAATANTGGGGGGGGDGGSNGGAGGSGVVILRYSNVYTILPSAGLTYSTMTNGDFTTAIFTAGTGTVQFVETASLILVDYLVIAGGGGGGSTTYDTSGGGGGGAGGYRTSVGTSGGGAAAEAALALALATNYTVTVGAGQPSGSNGSNSVFSTVTSLGGGRGGGPGTGVEQASGGSGGGAGRLILDGVGGAGTTGQGFAGGNSTSGAPYGAAGGGGASAVGGSFVDGGPSGDGGAGVSSSITGTAIFRGGGGGGGETQTSPSVYGLGGVGGGGQGGENANGFAGEANTGGGGGGAANRPTGYTGGAGGSGVVIVRYSATKTISVGAGLTSSTTTVGANKVTVLTAGTGTVSFT